jgi:hypothetical protein
MGITCWRGVFQNSLTHFRKVELDTYFTLSHFTCLHKKLGHVCLYHSFALSLPISQQLTFTLLSYSVPILPHIISMSFSMKVPFLGFRADTLKALMRVGQIEAEISEFGAFPFPIWIQNQNTHTSYSFTILAHKHSPLPNIKVDEITIKFQRDIFYISQIRNLEPGGQVLSTIRMKEDGLQGWVVQCINAPSDPIDQGYLTVWSQIDLPHTKAFQENRKWRDGLSWEGFYSDSLFFISEMFEDN